MSTALVSLTQGLMALSSISVLVACHRSQVTPQSPALFVMGVQTGGLGDGQGT